MKNLLLHCRELVTDDIIGRLLTPLACAVALLTKSVPNWFRLVVGVMFLVRVNWLDSGGGGQCHWETSGLKSNC